MLVFSILKRISLYQSSTRGSLNALIAVTAAAAAAAVIPPLDDDDNNGCGSALFVLVAAVVAAVVVDDDIDGTPPPNSSVDMKCDDASSMLCSFPIDRKTNSMQATYIKVKIHATRRQERQSETRGADDDDDEGRDGRIVAYIFYWTETGQQF